MTCVQRKLAQSGPFRVDGCEKCGSVSVHVGPTTLRLDPRALQTLSTVLLRAAAHLEGPTRGVLLPREAEPSAIN